MSIFIAPVKTRQTDMHTDGRTSVVYRVCLVPKINRYQIYSMILDVNRLYTSVKTVNLISTNPSSMQLLHRNILFYTCFGSFLTPIRKELTFNNFIMFFRKKRRKGQACVTCVSLTIIQQQLYFLNFNCHGNNKDLIIIT